jgi:hypothetical protein
VIIENRKSIDEYGEVKKLLAVCGCTLFAHRRGRYLVASDAMTLDEIKAVIRYNDVIDDNAQGE